MASPIPAQARMVVITVYPSAYSDSGSELAWDPKHPLDSNWWWINADQWCLEIGETIGQVATSSTLSDDALAVKATVITSEGTQAGLYITGGTPNACTPIRVVLTSSVSALQWSGDINLPIQDVGAVEANPSGFATLHGSIVVIGGFKYPLSE